jgi:hypothetical protein
MFVTLKGSFDHLDDVRGRVKIPAANGGQKAIEPSRRFVRFHAYATHTRRTKP